MFRYCNYIVLFCVYKSLEFVKIILNSIQRIKQMNKSYLSVEWKL